MSSTWPLPPASDAASPLPWPPWTGWLHWSGRRPPRRPGAPRLRARAPEPARADARRGRRPRAAPPGPRAARRAGRRSGVPGSGSCRGPVDLRRAGFLGFGAGVGLGLGLGFRFGLLGQQRLPVGDRDLVVVGMDFAEGQEAVAVAAVVDEGRLQRRLHARHLRQVDVAAQQLARGQFVVELLYPAVAQHHDPGLFRVRGIDEHLVAFVHVMGSLAPRRPAERRSWTCPVRDTRLVAAPISVAGIGP